MSAQQTFVVAIDGQAGSDIAAELDAQLDGDVHHVAPRSLDGLLGDADGLVVDADAVANDAIREALADRQLPTLVYGTPADCPDGIVAAVDRSHPTATDQLRQLAQGTFEGGSRATEDDRIARLHSVTTELVGAESERELYQIALSAATRILEFDVSYFAIAENDRFVPVGYGHDTDADLQEIPLDHGLTGKTYRTGESFLVHDVESHPVANAVHGIDGSGISVPLGEFGVFQTVSNEPHAYTESDLGLAELLATYTAETIARLRSERALRERERELERQNERLDEFTSVVSHDLRTPLTVARGHLDLARETGDDEHLQKVADAHERMDALLSDLLELSRRGALVGEFELLSLREVAQTAWMTVDTGDAALDVVSTAPVHGDRDRLVQLFENLFVNSVAHGGAGVTVTVSPTDDGFYVADDGPGIPDDDRARVFDRGFSTDADGTGFGLAIVAEIVDAHGWTISATESDAGGARFDVQF